MGRYQVEQLLASGAMGDVYIAFDPELERRVAVKVLRAQDSDKAEDLGHRLRREAKAMAKLSHPNVVTVHDVGSSHGRVFIAMELVDGVTLHEWLTGAPRSWHEVVDVFILAGRGLAAAHSAGLVHRDFKPDNVLVTHDRNVLVTDFGLVRTDMDAAPDSSADSSSEPALAESRLTRTGTLMGTPAYMAPEQIDRSGVDARSDVFSFCVALWEGLYGRRPFAGATLAQLHAAIRSGRTTTAAATSDAPPEVRDVLLIGLRDDPAQRYSSMAPLLEKLVLSRAGRAPTGHPGSPRALPAAEAPSTPRRPTSAPATLAWRLAALVTAMVLLSSGWVLWRNRQTRTPAIPRAQIVVSIALRNLSGRATTAWLSKALADMLGAELGQGQASRVRVLDGNDLARTNAERQVSAGDTLPASELKRLRHELDADLVVVGSYTALDDKSRSPVRMSFNVQETVHGRTIASVTESGQQLDLFAMVARAAESLRRGIGVEPVRAESASMATSPADEVARLYAAGVASLRTNDAPAARGYFEKAISRDPQHALSRLGLSQAWEDLGYHGRAKEEMQHAISMTGVLTGEQRLSIEAYKAMLATEWPKAIAAYETLFRLFPDDLDYGFQLADVQWRASNASQALATIERLRSARSPAHDDPRLDLYQASAMYLLGDLRGQREAAAKAKRKAITRGALGSIAAAEYLEAAAAVNLNDLDEATALAEDAREIWSRIGNRNAMGLSSALLAQSFQARGQYQNALRLYDEWSAISEEIGDREHAATALDSSATVLRVLGRFDEAMVRLERAVTIDREIHSRALAMGLVHVARAQMGRGDIIGAKQSLAESTAIARREGNSTTLVNSLLGSAEVLQARGELHKAMDLTTQATTVARAANFRWFLPAAISMQADLLATGDDFEGARKLVEEIRGIAEKAGNRSLLTSEDLASADYDLKEDRPAEAEARLRDLLGRPNESVRPDARARARHALVRALLRQGKTREAQEELQRATAAAPREGTFLDRLRTTLTLARVEAANGQGSSAESRIDRALKEARAAHWVALELEARLARVEVLPKARQRALARSLHVDASRRGFSYIAKKAALLAR